jgi:hypothetical protein
MSTNKFFLPLGSESVIKEEFGDKVLIYLHNENTISIEFQEKINGQDLINLFFCGAKWALNLNIQIDSYANCKN